MRIGVSPATWKKNKKKNTNSLDGAQSFEGSSCLGLPRDYFTHFELNLLHNKTWMQRILFLWWPPANDFSPIPSNWIKGNKPHTCKRYLMGENYFRLFGEWQNIFYSAFCTKFVVKCAAKIENRLKNINCMSTNVFEWDNCKEGKSIFSLNF